MKLFLIGWASVIPEHIHVAEELARNHKILYWLHMQDVVHVEKENFPDTVFHDYRAALKGVPPDGVDTLNFVPWSKDDISQFSAIESELLSMMDKWYPDWPVLKRKDFYYDLLCYWGGILKQFQPDIIIFSDVPHQMFDFVIYEIAKRWGIRTIMMDPILRHDRLVTYSDFRAGNDVLARWKQFAKATSLEELAPETRDYYREVSNSKEPSPVHFTEWRRETTGFNKFRRRAKSLVPFIKDGSIFERAVMRIFKMLKSNVKDEHRRLENFADLDRPYVYVPIHYQPELTTSPQGGIFVDQVLMVKTLSAALPRGWELFVKEHPAQWMAHGGNFTSYRYQGFYESIACLPNVRLVPIATNTFILTDHAKAVATAAGTCAIEAILRGKCALVFGYPWFMHAPGIFRVASVDHCREALARVEEGARPDQSEILSYLRVVERASFRGYLTREGAQAATYGTEETWRSVLRAVKDAIEKQV